MLSVTDPSESRLDRLGDAIDLYLAYRAGPSGDPASFLRANEDLRDLLEPMFLEDGIDIDAEPKRTSREWQAGKELGRLGAYVLRREIGRGGMGVVYEAYQESLDRRVALKVLAPHLAASPHRVERFRREAAASARLRHPGIVPVFEVGAEDGTFWYAMEFVDGPSLGQILEHTRQASDAEDGQLPSLGIVPGSSLPAEAAELIAQVAEALEHAHQNGVIHRDVKPQNILVRDGVALLVDFGLAKDLDKDSISRSGDFAGTPHYMSPEQTLAKRAPVDKRTDVYSLGVVLYEMMTGQRPFDGETSQEVLFRISFREPVMPRRHNSDIPRDLETICLKALEKSPERRYASAGELAADLRRFLRHIPIEAKAQGPITRVVKLARRQPAWAASIVLAFLLLVVTPLAFVWRNAASERRIENERQKTAAVKKEADERVAKERRSAEGARAEAAKRVAAEKKRAATERERANRTLADAMHAIEKMFDQASHAQLGPQPDAKSRASLTSSLQLYESVLEGQSGAAPIAYEVALAWTRAALIHRSLGRRAEAEKAARRSIQITSELLVAATKEDESDAIEIDPKHVGLPDLDGALVAPGAATRSSTAGSVRSDDTSPAGASRRRKARTLVQELAPPVRRSRLLELRAHTRNELAALLGRAAKRKECREVLEASDADWLRLAEAGHPLADLGRAQVLTNLGTLRLGFADFAGAIERFEAGRELFAKLEPEIAKRRSVRIKIGKMLTTYGTCLESARKRSKAARVLVEASELMAGLVAEDPGSPIYRATRAQALHNLGVILQQRRPEKARESLESAVSECRELVSRWSKRPDFRATLARSLAQLGRFLRVRGEADTGMARLEEARSELAGLDAKSALDVDAQRSYGMLLAEIGFIRHRGREVEAAEQALRTSHRILRKLKARHVRFKGDTGVFAAVCVTLAPTLIERRAFDTAEPVLVDAVAALQQVIAELPRGAPGRMPGLGASRVDANQRLEQSWRDLVKARLELGRHAAACAAATEYAKTHESEDAAEFCLRALARCYGLAANGGEARLRKEQQQVYVDNAIGLLERAIRAGWRELAKLGQSPDKELEALLGVESISRRLDELRQGGR